MLLPVLLCLFNPSVQGDLLVPLYLHVDSGECVEEVRCPGPTGLSSSNASWSVPELAYLVAGFEFASLALLSGVGQ
jgi:hypothetical protein